MKKNTTIIIIIIIIIITIIINNITIITIICITSLVTFNQAYSLNSAFIAFTLPWQWSHQEVQEYVPHWDQVISDDDVDDDWDDDGYDFNDNGDDDSGHDGDNDEYDNDYRFSTNLPPRLVQAFMSIYWGISCRP